jgi:hypothetical protein
MIDSAELVGILLAAGWDLEEQISCKLIVISIHVYGKVCAFKRYNYRNFSCAAGFPVGRVRC